ncbi:MFS transporter [Fervidicoccus fontis]|uniref:MFS transporter n=1 Tax=Fervidicoccus fontis TaxID=683846 RepID=A0A843ALF8_9CREN|nr:MFS transporter [Fervidicoccus fontis]MBE9391741.1 MFS transporter [Fervidicoccus fontis]
MELSRKAYILKLKNALNIGWVEIFKDLSKKIRMDPFYVVMFIEGLAFGTYIVTIRTNIGMENYNAYSFLTLIAAMETIPGIFSVFAGGISDKIGRKKIIFFSGLMSSIFLILLSKVQLSQLPIFVFLFMSFYTMFYPIIFGISISKSKGSGYSLSKFLFFNSFGWSLGGILPGLILNLWNLNILYIIAAILIIIASVITVISYNEKEYQDPTVTLTDFKNEIKKAIPFLFPLILGSAGFYMLNSIMSLRLFISVNNILLYGIFYNTITGLLSSIARLIAGKAIEKIHPYKVTFSSFFSYLILALLMEKANSTLTILLWLLPIYPFFETSSYYVLGRMIKTTFHSTASGLFTTAVSLGGIINLSLSLVFYHSSYQTLLIIDSILLLIPSIYLIFLVKSSNRN